jgi:ectoine hydroxylase-related dioxygenase (phytanoyl-CoA dioxygenase family)
MGDCPLELDSPLLGRLRDANDLLGDVAALKSRLEEDGYLLIRDIHGRAKVQAARDVILRYLDSQRQIDRRRPLDQAYVNPEADSPGGLLSRVEEVVRSRAVLDVLEGEPVMSFFRQLLGGDVFTFPYKWLRAVPPGSNTGAHYDVVYMGRGTRNLFTCWTPLCDIGIEHGPLAVLVGSHRFDELRRTYGQSDVDRDKTDGWYSRDPVEVVRRWGGQWQTSEFAMGDAMIFGMFTMHASLNNVSDQFRFSCDTRYQRDDEPKDERWIGAAPLGHEGDTKTSRV